MALLPFRMDAIFLLNISSHVRVILQHLSKIKIKPRDEQTSWYLEIFKARDRRELMKLWGGVKMNIDYPFENKKIGRLTIMVSLIHKRVVSTVKSN